MKQLKILLKNDVYTSDYPHIISTTLYFEHEGRCFPDDQWTDFTYPVLDTWALTLINNQMSSDVKFELLFMDGPYKLEITKDSTMQLMIDCVNIKQGNVCEYTVTCGYWEFLSALNETMREFVRILHDRGMDSGIFSAAYKQSISTMKRLHDILKNQKEE